MTRIVGLLAARGGLVVRYLQIMGARPCLVRPG